MILAFMRGEKAQISASRARQRTAQILRALRDSVEDSDLAYATIEARAGFERGYLSQVLTGHIELKLHHVFTVLDAIGRRRGAFFAALFPLGPKPGGGSRWLAQSLGVGADVVRIYSAGIEAVEGLQPRLRHCEEALTRLLENDRVRQLVTGRASRSRSSE